MISEPKIGSQEDRNSRFRKLHICILRNELCVYRDGISLISLNFQTLFFNTPRSNEF